MDKINTTVKINQDIDVEVSMYDLIECINNQPMTIRWNVISKLLNEIEINSVQLIGDQKELVKKYLEKKLDFFNEKQAS